MGLAGQDGSDMGAGLPVSLSSGLFQGVCTSWIDADQQPPRSLGIEKQLQQRFIKGFDQLQPRLNISPVGLARPGSELGLHEVENAWQEWQSVEVDFQADITTLGHFVAVAGQSEAGNIGDGMDTAHGAAYFGSCFV